MSNREDFFEMINGREVRKIFFSMSCCDSIIDQLEQRYGTRDFYSYFGVPFSYINIEPSHKSTDYSSYFANLSYDVIDEWGLGHRYGSIAHFSSFVSPMANFDTPKQVYNFPMSDYLADYRWEKIADRISRAKAADKITITGGPAIDIFEPSWYLRGLENMMCDFLLSPEMAEACLERTCAIKYKIAEKYAKVGFDIIIFGDDVGTERGMMMSPEIWREWIKPRLKKALDIVHTINPDILCYYHSDGDIRLIIPELIDIGVDILNPIQPECMNPAEIYNTYADRVAFWGTIGTQTTMPFGSVEDVENKTSEMIELCRDRGKLVIAPTHLLEPEVPIENIEAFVRTIRNYNLMFS